MDLDLDLDLDIFDGCPGDIDGTWLGEDDFSEVWFSGSICSSSLISVKLSWWISICLPVYYNMYAM